MTIQTINVLRKLEQCETLFRAIHASKFVRSTGLLWLADEVFRDYMYSLAHQVNEIDVETCLMGIQRLEQEKQR